MNAQSSVVLPLMHSRANAPKPGIIVRVFLKNGEERKASCTWITHAGGRELQWYDSQTRRVIDRDMIKGWMPAIFRNEGLVAVTQKFGVGPGELRDVTRPVFDLMEAYGMETLTISRSGPKATITIDGLTIE